jgi:predicted metal-dependent hydrolase
MPEMKARFPRFDFSNVRAHWAPVVEFAQSGNAASLIPAHIEPYLLKVMRKCQPLLKQRGASPELQRDLDIFIKQEMQHCKQHISFNNRIHALGYEALKPLETKLAADFDEFLNKRSLRFNLAYCEGFESMSATACIYYFEDYLPYLEGADKEPADMWKWHLAEEFEHRTVCFDVFHELSGLDPVSRYFYRVYGYFYALVHLAKFAIAAGKVLTAIDHKSMSPEEIAASQARAAAVKKVTKSRMPGMMLTILAPWYHPRNRREPLGYSAYLAQFEAERCPTPAALREPALA